MSRPVEMARRGGGVALCVLAAWAGGLGCRSEEKQKTPKTEPASVHAALDPGKLDRGNGAAAVARGEAVERGRFDGPAPAAAAPADARVGPLDVRYAIVQAGTGAVPDPTQLLLLELRAWNEAGELVTDTLAMPQPLELSPGALPEPLRVELARQRVGTRLQLWLPAAATQGFRRMEWPREGQLRLEVVVLGTREPPPATVRQLGSLRTPKRFAPPSVSGPSNDAKTAPGGVRYEWLASGPEGSQPRAGSQVQLELSAHAMSGVVVSKVLSEQPTTLTMGQAPAGLQPVLDQMVVGDTVRVWLPEERARQVLPQVSSAAVLDVTLLDVL